MPEPLRSGLAAACRRPLLATITGRDSEHWASECDTAPAGRLTVIALASIITAYEHAMTEGEKRAELRLMQLSARRDAGVWGGRAGCRLRSPDRDRRVCQYRLPLAAVGSTMLHLM
jgi:hypothetical protein